MTYRPRSAFIVFFYLWKTNENTTDSWGTKAEARSHFDNFFFPFACKLN